MGEGQCFHGSGRHRSLGGRLTKRSVDLRVDLVVPDGEVVSANAEVLVWSPQPGFPRHPVSFTLHDEQSGALIDTQSRTVAASARPDDLTRWLVPDSALSEGSYTVERHHLGITETIGSFSVGEPVDTEPPAAPELLQTTHGVCSFGGGVLGLEWKEPVEPVVAEIRGFAEFGRVARVVDVQPNGLTSIGFCDCPGPGRTFRIDAGDLVDLEVTFIDRAGNRSPTRHYELVAQNASFADDAPAPAEPSGGCASVAASPSIGLVVAGLFGLRRRNRPG